MINKKIEDVVKVSTRGQIVIPKEIRKRMGVSAGERLLVMSEDRGILIKKLESLSMEEIGERIEATAKKKGIDVDKLIDEATKWARSK